MIEHEERLSAMIADDQETWDLSPKDKEAIKWALRKAIDGTKDRLALCGQAAIEVLGLGLDENSPANVREGILAAQKSAVSARHATAEYQEMSIQEAGLRMRYAAALRSVVKISAEAFKAWDSDKDSRVGKILSALAGHNAGYRADIDEILELVSP